MRDQCGFCRRRLPISILVRLTRTPHGRLGLILVVLLLGAVVLAPLITPHDPIALDASVRLQPPSLAYPMGTDAFGRDVLSRVLYGGRVSLLVATVSVGTALLIGLVLGGFAGYRGGVADEVTMRATDVLFALPSVLLAIAIIAFLGPGPANAALAITIVFIAPLTRVVRSGVLAVRNRPFVEAARLGGSGGWRLLRGHIYPNAMAPVVVQATVFFGYAIIIEAALGYLGLGLAPPAPSWGEMLNSSRALLSLGPWLAFFPGLTIAVAVVGVNLLGDGLRDAMDPLVGT